MCLCRHLVHITPKCTGVLDGIISLLHGFILFGKSDGQDFDEMLRTVLRYFY